MLGSQRFKKLQKFIENGMFVLPAAEVVAKKWVAIITMTNKREVFIFSQRYYTDQNMKFLTFIFDSINDVLYLNIKKPFAIFNLIAK